MVPGLSGIRKIRFQLGNRRSAIDFLVIADGLAIMVYAYAKSDREDMTHGEKVAAKRLIEEWGNVED